MSSGTKPNIWGFSSAGRALAWHARGHRFDPGNLHQKKASHRNVWCFFVVPPSGSALGSPFGRAGFAKQRLRGRGRQDVQMPLPVAAPPVKNAFGALRRVRQTQNYKEPFRGIWSERSGDHFKSSRSQGTDCKAFTDLQPLNSYWTIAQSYGIILSAIAGIVHRLVYQPSKLRRWVRFPLPAPQDLNLERFGSFLFVRAAILPTGGGNATIEPSKR